MKADDLKRFEIIRTDAHGKNLFLGSQRVLILPTAALVNIIRDLMQIMDKDKMEVVMIRFGYEIGITSAMNLKELYSFDSVEEQLKAGAKLLDFSGIISESVADIASGVIDTGGSGKVSVKDSFQAVSWLTNFGPSDKPVCTILAGMASGYVSTVLGEDVLVQEIQCQAAGHPACVFEGRRLADWGIDPDHLRRRLELNHLDEHIKQLSQTLDTYRKHLNKQNLELASLKKKIRTEQQVAGIVHRSAGMSQSLEVAKKVAPTAAPVLIQGESGTGKELIARFIHENSPRKNAPFVAVSCAALPADLLESEFFGHVKGAFTGANSDKKGLLEEAGSGTFFLDEVGELPLELQAKLLRALQEKEIRPVGGVRHIPIQCRIVSATHRDLKKMIQEGTFREDLFYRIAVVPVHLSPLRERPEDILVLARHFIEKNNPEHPGISPEAVHCMEAYSWPGNVRELENCIQYAMVFAGDDLIRQTHLPLTLTQNAMESVAVIGADLPDLRELERRYIRNVLERTAGNKTAAAGILGISITTLWRRLREFGLS